MYQARRGMSRDEIDTPALLIDLDVLEANLDRMAGTFASAGATLRPHVKTHKSPIIAHAQLRRGASGVTCAKLGEAEVMVAAGIPDVLIANQIVGAPKLRLLTDLARRAKITVAVDDLQNLAEVAAAAREAGVNVGVLVEIDVGLGRCGARTAEQALALAGAAECARGVTYAGLQGYEGHCVFLQDPQERKRAASEAYALLARVSEDLARHGLPPQVVSGGGTGTHALALAAGVLTEVQAGSYVFMDGRYRGLGDLGFGCALSVLTTVVSRPDRRRIITDCGLKSIGTDFGLPSLKHQPGWQCIKAAEEHLIWDATEDSSEDFSDLAPGDKVEVIPSHGCTTVNLHDFYAGLRGNLVETVWPIAGRGRSF